MEKFWRKIQKAYKFWRANGFWKTIGMIISRYVPSKWATVFHSGGYKHLLPYDFNLKKRDERFNYIYEHNVWGSNESVSGGGSEKERTYEYRKQLEKLLKDYEVESIFDAPCGDFNWMPMVLQNTTVDYIGGDIVDKLVEKNIEKHLQFNFIKFDLCVDAFPYVDLWHCRDCLFHLSFNDISQVLNGFLKSEIKYVLLTTHKIVSANSDIDTGDFRYLDLFKQPFKFEAPLKLLLDSGAGADIPQYVGLWDRDQVRRAINNFNSQQSL